MGLDNGIILRHKGEVYAPSYVKIEKFEEENGDINWEVCYWRKCQGVRNEILGVIGHMVDDGGEYDLTPSMLEKIRNVMYEQLCYPESWYSQIWSFDEMIPHLAQEIVNISWLLDFMKENPHATAYFYDSY